MREVPLVMPKMSMTMTEGTFLVWHRQEGEAIKAGDIVCEVASDKVDMEVESPIEGTLSRLVATPDQVIAVGAPLAFINSEADDLLAGIFDDAPAPAPQTAQTTAPAPAAAASPPSRRGPRPAVPFARRRASELHIDINAVTGSGSGGLITVSDVESAAAGTKHVATNGVAAAVAPPAVQTTTPTTQPTQTVATSDEYSVYGDTVVEPLSRIAKVSGPALTRSWTTIPHVTHHDDADITDLDSFRRELDTAAKAEGYRVTLLAFLLKGVVSALKTYPRVNSSLAASGGALVLKRYYHIGVAVDTDQGLVVPVVRDVDRKGIVEISKDLAAISGRARDGKLTGDDIGGASFTVSSLGGIGGTSFTPIVNSPEAAILGVAKSSIQPVWDGEQFVPRLVLPLSLSYDHRIVDGALAARFTAHLGQLLGDVRRLLL